MDVEIDATDFVFGGVNLAIERVGGVGLGPLDLMVIGDGYNLHFRGMVYVGVERAFGLRAYASEGVPRLDVVLG